MIASLAAVSRVGRYAKATAKPGQGDALAELMLDVAATLNAFPGCELYVINRVVEEPDVIWVTEIWSDQEAVEASLSQARGSDLMPKVMAVVESFERTDVVPVGGVGLT